jgi:hypothetical protein
LLYATILEKEKVLNYFYYRIDCKRKETIKFNKMDSNNTADIGKQSI